MLCNFYQYINSLLKELSDHCFAISIKPALSFADDTGLKNVLKNYCGSFSSNISDNIDKTRKKAGMIFSSNVDRRKTNPLIYVKFWRQACLPSLLFGAELFTLTPSLLLELERYWSWFLKKTFLCARVHSYLG